MRKLFWQQMMSLDGFMEGEKGIGDLDWFVTDDEFGDYVLERWEERSTRSSSAG